jgi:hypothetical protein
MNPYYTPGVDLLDHAFYVILKNSHQYLSNEGSNFILSPLEVVQTWAFFDKLPEITDFGLLQEFENKFRPRGLII